MLCDFWCAIGESLKVDINSDGSTFIVAVDRSVYNTRYVYLYYLYDMIHVFMNMYKNIMDRMTTFVIIIYLHVLNTSFHGLS